MKIDCHTPPGKVIKWVFRLRYGPARGTHMGVYEGETALKAYESSNIRVMFGSLDACPLEALSR